MRSDPDSLDRVGSRLGGRQTDLDRGKVFCPGSPRRLCPQDLPLLEHRPEDAGHCSRPVSRGHAAVPALAPRCPQPADQEGGSSPLGHHPDKPLAPSPGSHNLDRMLTYPRAVGDKRVGW